LITPVEVAAELAQQQVVRVETTLVIVKDVVAMSVEQVARLLDDVLVDHGGVRAMVVGDAIEQCLQVVGPALEYRLARAQALVVGDQLVAAGAVLLRRGGRGQDRHRGLPDPDVGLLVQEAARLLEVAVSLAEPRVRPSWSISSVEKRPSAAITPRWKFGMLSRSRPA
jgi:hypothetical protein